MYDNNCSNNCERTSGSICINAGYLAIALAIIAGIAAYFAFNAGVLFLVPALTFGILGALVLLGLVVLVLVNVYLIRCKKLCCCAKRRALGYLVTALISLIALALYFAIPTIAAILVGITIGFLVLAVLFFIGFYQCFLRCRCNTCECRDRDCDE